MKYILTVKDGDFYTVVGVVSLGYSCAEQYTPRVCTNVQKYIVWIHSVLNSYAPASPIMAKRNTDDLFAIYKYMFFFTVSPEHIFRHLTIRLLFYTSLDTICLTGLIQ